MKICVARIENMDMRTLWFLDLEVEGQSTTFQTVKEKIQTAKGIPINQQCLIFGGTSIVEDNTILADYNIHEGCTLKLVLKALPSRPFENIVRDDYYVDLIQSHAQAHK